MRAKILCMLSVILLVSTSVGVLAVDSNEGNAPAILEESHQVLFSELSISESGDYLSASIVGANTNLMQAGKPILPVYTKTFIFPKGTKIKDVEFTLPEVKSQIVSGKIQPAPTAQPVSILTTTPEAEEEQTSIEDTETYSGSDLYPGLWYDYKISCGLHDGKDSIFVKIDCYPMRYLPSTDTVYYVENVDFKISYEQAPSTSAQSQTYSLLIIAPRRFKLPLLRLSAHKTRMGVPNIIMTTEEIYRNYDGRDKPEQIKYFIKYAKEAWGIQYVLLFGGLKSHLFAKDREGLNQGSKAWYVPVRYANHWYEPDEYGYISDLYYADLYRVNGTTHEQEFEDWDSNGNGIFAENYSLYESDHWVDYIDTLDMYPDVYYGRIPCRNIFEVRAMVNKIIKYEKSGHADESWYKTMVTVGGRTFGYYGDDLDGEYLCNLSIESMNSIIDNPVRIFSSHIYTGELCPVARTIRRELSKGTGFVLFQGHGNPYIWDTHWPEWKNETESNNWTGGIITFDFLFLRNRNKVPIVVVGGCHNGLFNVTSLVTFSELAGQPYHFTYGVPVSECFSWKICAKPRGGAIACTGCTAFGIGYPSDPLSLSAQLENNYFYKIGVDGVETVGQAHSGSIEKYLNENIKINNFDNTYAVTEFQQFGDPSLKIGGYS